MHKCLQITKLFSFLLRDNCGRHERCFCEATPPPISATTIGLRQEMWLEDRKQRWKCNLDQPFVCVYSSQLACVRKFNPNFFVPLSSSHFVIFRMKWKRRLEEFPEMEGSLISSNINLGDRTDSTWWTAEFLRCFPCRGGRKQTETISSKI